MELLTTLAIFAVVATLAAPGLRTLQLDARRTAVVNGFLHSVFLARSEAIKRGSIVSVCRSGDGRSCDYSGADWNIGWIVFANQDQDEPPQLDPSEEVIAHAAAWPGGSIASNRPAYSFRPVTQAV
ncbi:MAG TPA: GspH/FimT family pseudopilin, partial [Steroidobacteraceae bacterium]